MSNGMARISMVTACLGLVFGPGSRVEAGPVQLQTPSGLNPGQTFRFVFLTDGTMNATSSDIATYNTFVNGQAGGATYNGSVVQWFAIGSTSSINAVNNIGGQTPITGVFLSNGTEIATSTTFFQGIFSGFLMNPIDTDLNGNININTVWTGTLPSGNGSDSNFLGSSNPLFGGSGATNGIAIDAGTESNNFSNPFYGISQVLTAVQAVPEPATLWPAATVIALGLTSTWLRARHPGVSYR
jgi:hypothetical protein